jgi:Baseplate J-like protein
VSDLRPEPPRLPSIPPGTEACGCCEGVDLVTPQRVENRGGLSEIRYRIGTWVDFRTSLHAGLSSQDAAALHSLTTRGDDDISIGLLDAFACAADVLTFYQERIANESWLGTARESVSLEEMGRLIGYRLRPGVAAETSLAFTLETPPTPPVAVRPEPGMFVTGVPAKITIDTGLAVRSVPAPGDVPQVFETVEAIEARPAWNALRPWMGDVVMPVRGTVSTWLAGVNTRLKPGDALLFVGDEYFRNNNVNQWDFRILDRVAADVDGDRTFVSWRRPLGSIDPPLNPAARPRAFALRRRAAVYGHNAPNWNTMPAEFQSAYHGRFDLPESGPVLLGIRASASAPDDWPRFVVTPGAIDPTAMPAVDLDAVYSEMPTGSFVVLAKGGFNYPVEPGPPGTYVELYTVTAVSEVSREEFALSGKVTRLGLSGANYSLFASQVRGTAVFGQSESLAFTETPVTSDVTGDRVPVAIDPEGLEPGRHLLVRGRRARDGGAAVYAVTLVAAQPAGAGRSLLQVTPPLPEPLARDSVVVHANVALASHGETVSQILGAGNAALAFQRFELKQLPLTYRAAANELGASPEITLRVDDIAWKPRDTLFGSTPRERAFVLLGDEQGRKFVQFGDGVRGARLSSGQNNVRATYRKGLGVAGNLAAESLTQLTQRPLGVKGVSNPLPAEGGTNPESPEEARQTMPLRTRTLGRAVSLLDYEDFARAFAGVAKARAAVLRLPAGPVIAITIAGPGGVVISPASPVWIHLAEALVGNGDPHVAVRLLAHQARTFRLGLKIRRDPDYESRQVLAAVEAALRARFSFEARALGQPVQQSEIFAVAQAVRGVIAVDLDFFYKVAQPPAQTSPSCQVRLLAARMHVAAGAAVADEILTLAPGPFDRLEEMP